MKTAADWMKDPTAYTTSIMLLMVDKFGTDFIEWDPTTVNLEIKDAFGFEPRTALLDRVQAGASLFTSNLFQVSLETFSAVCNAMNFGAVTSEVFLPADLDDVLWGVTEAKLLMGSDFDSDFSSNIQNYVGVLLGQAGFNKAPSILSFASVKDIPDDVPDTLSDPILERAVYEKDQTDKAEIEQWNSAKIADLLSQIRNLPLQTGSTEFIDQIMEGLKAL